MSPFERLLERLDGVRMTGPDRAVTKCPAHPDKRPSLSVRELEDGRVLLWCFAGCGASDVVAAIGLTLADLFDQPPDHHRAPVRDRRHTHAARDALRIIAQEALLVAIAAENIAAGRALTDDDRERLHDAALRIRAARDVAA